jgi:hypothetical protein
MPSITCSTFCSCCGTNLHGFESIWEELIMYHPTRVKDGLRWEHDHATFGEITPTETVGRSEAELLYGTPGAALIPRLGCLYSSEVWARKSPGVLQLKAWAALQVASIQLLCVQTETTETTSLYIVIPFPKSERSSLCGARVKLSSIFTAPLHDSYPYISRIDPVTVGVHRLIDGR